MARERRSEVRMLCADLVEISWQDPSGRIGEAPAVLEDISTSGACLHLDHSLPLDAVVSWRSPKIGFRGCVRYCAYREVGYFVGVRFDANSKWSKRRFVPQHLLDPRRLLA